MVFLLGNVTFLLNLVGEINHALVNAPLKAEAIEGLDVEPNGSGDLSPMARLNTFCTHSHGHGDVLSEFSYFLLDLLSNFLVGYERLSSENTDRTGQSTVGLIHNSLQLVRAE
jgi:hypothetical protein